MPIFSRSDALELHIFFKSYQLLGKILEHNVYKINISLDVLYLMQTANLYIFTGNLKGKIVQKVQAMKKYIKYPKYDAFYNTWQGKNFLPRFFLLCKLYSYKYEYA